MSNDAKPITNHIVERFVTERMIATRVTDDDFDELCVLHADEQTMATLGGVRDAQVTRMFLDNKLAHWEQYGHGMWMFFSRETGDFIGRGLVEHFDFSGGHEVELGYTVSRPFWHMGYATEIASAMLCVAFGTLDLASIVAFTYPDNLGSRRVMEKNGFSYECDIEHMGRPYVLYRLQHDDYAGTPTLQEIDGEIVVA